MSTFHINEPECGQAMNNFTAVEGIVHVMRVSGRHHHNYKCTFHIEVPEGRYANACVDLKRDNVGCGKVVVYQTLPMSLNNEIGYFHCRMDPVSFLPSSTNHLYFKYRNDYYTARFIFSVHFWASHRSLRNYLPVVFNTSLLSGCMTSPGYDGHVGVPLNLDIRQELKAPEDHVIMISFERVDIFKGYIFCLTFLELSAAAAVNETLWTTCDRDRDRSPDVFNTSTLIMRLRTRSHMAGNKVDPNIYVGRGFEIMYTFHSRSSAPMKLASGYFNCSVPYFSHFRQHISCNVKVECSEREDETGSCPFSTDQCQGFVASVGKCYFYVNTAFNEGSFSWYAAQATCRSKGGELAAVKTQREWLDMNKIFIYGKEAASRAHVGMLYDENSVPFMYRHMFRWTDKTMVYFMSHVSIDCSERFICYVTIGADGRLCVSRKPDGLIETVCYDKSASAAVCQTQLVPSSSNHKQPLKLSIAADFWLKFDRKDDYVPCLEEHFIHTFLFCDPDSHCGMQRYVEYCPVFEANGRQQPIAYYGDWGIQFMCDQGSTISYTLVCDHHHQCPDGSDESFCHHPSCNSFLCTNGQCLNNSRRCNGLPDCLDRSDELDCTEGQENFRWEKVKPASFPSHSTVVELSGSGTFSMVTLDSNNSCPVTHYQCPSEFRICLPVYTRCNGFSDCVGGEDEGGCDHASCPGFYRCRSSMVCVHRNHLCDGWPQCPQHDDEWLCDLTCPATCLCQGHAFLCHYPFSAYMFPHLRHLEASASGIQLSDLSEIFYLIRLSMLKSSVVSLSAMNLPNLQYLDLRQNDIRDVNMSMFQKLVNLKTLKMAENPIICLSRGVFNQNDSQLRNVDLSKTPLREFDGEVLSQFQNVQNINLSFTDIRSIGQSGFRSIPHLKELEMRGSPIEHFPLDLYEGLGNLRVISTPNYRLCCPHVIPTQAKGLVCMVQQYNQLSSCENLLRSQMYQIYVWLAALLAVSGNMGCILGSTIYCQLFQNGFHVLITSLHIAQVLTGVYMGIIAVADLMFRQHYLQYERWWNSSVTCQLAGFLSVLAMEVSVLMIFCLGLNLFLVLGISHADRQLSKKSALACCLLAWLIGSVLAAVPLLPGTQHWEFYGQTSICIPLPANSSSFKGRQYVLAVPVTFNFVLVLVTAVMQVAVSVSLHQLATIQLSQEQLLSQRLVTVILTDCLTWLVVGIYGMAAPDISVSVHDPINVAVALVLMPINSALNPCLYTLSTWFQDRRIQQENRLLAVLKRRLDHRV